ncbi:MAG: hypothetical protein KAT68_10905 [Bacteroidales bacterium]|nr:hypothetical protein [Bacteroidales bacterium]
MKKEILLFITLFIISFVTVNSQVVFTVKPGFNLNGANIGYKTNKIVPYFGLQFINVSSKYKDSDDDDEINTHVFMPYAGSKFFIIDKESIKSSINATIFKPFIFGKEVDDGEEDDSYKENLKKLKIWGGELGFSSEYFFSEHFSVGGEFGFRFGFYKYEHDSGTENQYTEDLNMNMTYISGSMNFYF